MMREIGPILFGFALGALVMACLAYPRVGRAIGKIFAVLGIASGAGLLTLGLHGAIAQDFRAMQAGPILFFSASQVIGWGVGLLAAGITSLVLSLVGQRN